MKSSFLQLWEHFNSLHVEVEKNVEERTGSYQNLSPHALYTSPDDFLTIFAHPLVTGTFCDLGCGNALSVLFYNLLNPDRRALGVEFEMARLHPAIAFIEENSLQNVTLIHADLGTCDIPEADCYFLYFPTGPVLDRILTTLYETKKKFRLLVIESHGDLIPRINLENWLELKAEIPLASLRHYPMARLYERTWEKRCDRLHPFTLSFMDKLILVEAGEESWIGETLGMEWAHEDRFELKTPPRTIYWRDVKKLMILDELDQKTQKALRLRQLGELKILTRWVGYQGFIRKIFLRPSFQVEISSGEKVEWDDILTIKQGSLTCYESSSH